MHKDTVVMVPILNEETAITNFLERWSGYGWNFLFVDGLSQDTTLEKLSAFKASHPKEHIDVVVAPKEQGLAANSCLGFQTALDLKYDFIIVADVGTQVPADAARLLEIAQDRNPEHLVIPRGSYFVTGSIVRDFPRYRRLVSRGAAFVSKTILGDTGSYPTHAFKVWPRTALEAIPFHGLLDGTVAHCRNGPEFQVGMTWLSQQHGWQIPEYPMQFYGTKSTFRWKWIPNFIRQLRKMRHYSAPNVSK